LYNDDIICGASPALAKYMLESQAVPHECGKRPRPAFGRDLETLGKAFGGGSRFSDRDWPDAPAPARREGMGRNEGSGNQFRTPSDLAAPQR
jgi:hypothetical protein